MRAIDTSRPRTRELRPAELARMREAVYPVLVTDMDDALRPARGTVIGALISSAFWVMVGVGLVW